MKCRAAVAYNRAATEEYFKSKLDNPEVIIEFSERLQKSREDLTFSVKQFMNLFKRHPLTGEGDPGADVETADAQTTITLALPDVEARPAPQVLQVFLPTAPQISLSLTNISCPPILPPLQCHISHIPPFPLPQTPPLQLELQLQVQLPHVNRKCLHFPTKEYLQLHATFARNLKQRILNEIQERTARCQLKRQVAIQDSLSDVLDRDPLRVLAHVGYQAVLRHDEFNVPKTARHVDAETLRRNERKLHDMAEEFCLSDYATEVMHACDSNTKVRKRLGERFEP